MEDIIEVSLNDLDDVSEYKNYEKTRQENEANRISNEDTRQNNELRRENYYNFIKQKFDNGGFKGERGYSAYEIAVKNGFTGTEEEWLQSLHGKDGKNGVDGRDGVDGTNGTDGMDGVNGKDGKSAYEVAVSNGFVGTEQEWIASLKGQQGERGEKGEQGLQGIQGEKGDKGDSATYNDTELKNRMTTIENNIGDISTILDNINGEVI